MSLTQSDFDALGRHLDTAKKANDQLRADNLMLQVQIDLFYQKEKQWELEKVGQQQIIKAQLEAEQAQRRGMEAEIIRLKAQLRNGD